MEWNRGFAGHTRQFKETWDRGKNSIYRRREPLALISLEYFDPDCPQSVTWPCWLLSLKFVDNGMNPYKTQPFANLFVLHTLFPYFLSILTTPFVLTIMSSFKNILTLSVPTAKSLEKVTVVKGVAVIKVGWMACQRPSWIKEKTRWGIKIFGAQDGKI